MNNDLIEQWNQSNKLIIDSFKSIASANVSTMDKMLTSFVNPSASAEMTKSYISFTKELGEVYTDSINDMFQNQLKLINFQTTSESFGNLGNIYVDSMTNLGKQQAELMRLYIDTMAKYMETVKDAKKPEDLVNIQMSMFSELQEKVKNNMTATMGIFNSINSAMEIWTQKSLDSITDSDD